MVVENVRGANEWVGRSRWNFGSFHVWGDVPALMPPASRRVMKNGVTHRSNGSTNFHQGQYDGVKVPSFRFDGSGRSLKTAVCACEPGAVLRPEMACGSRHGIAVLKWPKAARVRVRVRSGSIRTCVSFHRNHRYAKPPPP